MKPFSIALADTNHIAAFEKLQNLPYALLLDSADRAHPDARYSFIACDPLETIEYKDGELTITNPEQLLTLRQNPFEILQKRLDGWGFSNETLEGLPPFQGGAAGLFGYDLARTLEDLPDMAIDNPDLPDMAVGIYDQVMAYDHAQDKAWIITHAKNEIEAQMKQAVLLDRLKKPAPKTRPNAALLRWKSNFKPAAFKARIKKAMNYIRAGDMFQANLAQRFDALLPENFDAFAHYKELRTHNPAPFACYMNVSDGVRISSASPERFLTVRGKAVTTRPIKGTRPRSNDPEANARAINDLQQSEKERAENIMIVDLLRNDLSKCCEAASIEVTQLCKLESFASVHHLVSTITGMLKGGKTPVDLLRACFPGGSITGAPKIRAMEIIEELEPTRRGPYCGSMGYIGFNGDMDSNILIRTLVYERGHVSLQAGGGITAASDPDAEYEETLDKARAIFESFESESELQKVG